MVPISRAWTPFADIDDKIKHYRLWGLIPPKSNSLRPVMVTDGYMGVPQPCEVVGYCGDNWAVIKLEDGYHEINGDYLAELQPAAQQKLPHGICFAEILSKYVVVDIETTGVNRQIDRIIEIGAATYEYGRKVSEYHTLVNPGQLLPPEIIKLTGITQDEVDQAPYLEEIVNDFRNYISNLPLIGHNILSFDIPFLKAHIGEFDNPGIDTLILARKVFDILPRHKLEYLKAVLDLSDVESHRALNDVEITNALLWACLAPNRHEAKVNKAYLESKLKSDGSTDKKRTSHKSNKPLSVKALEADPASMHNSALSGKTVVFTGTLSIDRKEAWQIAADAGAKVKTDVSKKTDYLVVGKQEIAIVGFDGMSEKEEKAHAINKSGAAHIEIIDEDAFMRLAKSEPDPLAAESSEEIDVQEQPPFPEEITAFEILKDCCKDMLSKLNVPTNLLILNGLKDKSAVCLVDEGHTVSHLRIRKNKKYITMPEDVQELLPITAQTYTLKSTPGILYIMISIPEDVRQYADAFCKAVHIHIQKYHTFDCCGRYMECSNAKQCIHPKPVEALGCTYKRNLEKGLIFYGENRNID